MHPHQAGHDDDAAEICLRCGEPNPQGLAQCPHCRSPLGSLSTGAPWEMMRARDVAHRSQTDPRQKPIVLIGVWLYFGPTATAAAYGLTLTPDPLSASLFFAYLALSAWVLTAVTRRFLHRH